MNQNEEYTRPDQKVKSDSYLYGHSLRGLALKPYTTVLVIKYKLADRLIAKLINEVNYDTTRLNAVFNARDFNRELLKELGYSDGSIKILIQSCDIEAVMSKLDVELSSTSVIETLTENFNQSLDYIKSNITNITGWLRSKV